LEDIYCITASNAPDLSVEVIAKGVKKKNDGQKSNKPTLASLACCPDA
jgi:hypothetical protein